MATNTEKIDELVKLGATLDERINNVRNEMVDRERIAVIEERLNELKRTVEESGRRQWSAYSLVMAAVVSGIVSILVQLVTNLKK